VSDADGKNPEFDEFDLPDGDLNLPDGDLDQTDAPDETLEFQAPGDGLEPPDDLLEPGGEPSESAFGDETAPPEPDGDLVDAEIGEISDVDEGREEEPPEEEAEEKGKKKRKKKEKEKKEKEKGPGLLEKLGSTSPYVIMLGISLLAIIIGIVCLLMELGRYGGQIKPTQARVAPAVQLGPLTTTAAT
jgi:hypothetical protein